MILPARLDHGLLRLLALIAAFAVAAVLWNPGLTIVLAPALFVATVAAVISYRHNRSDGWWKMPATAFVSVSAISLALTFYLLAQK